MKNINLKDIFVVQKKSVLTDFDRRVMSELYFPLIGSAGIALYFRLWALAERENYNEPASHELLSELIGLSLASLNEGKSYLEAMGLLRTFYDPKSKIYYYFLYAPKTPHDFFNDAVFYALLKEKVGENEFLRIRFAFIDQTFDDPSFKDVTVSFGEVFHPDFSNINFEGTNNGKTLIGRQSNNLTLNFDIEAFLSRALSLGLPSKELITPEIQTWLERVSALYGVKEEALAPIVLRYFEFESGTLDQNAVLQEVQNSILFSNNRKKAPKASQTTITRVGQSKMAKKIQVLESMSPVEYLKLLQGNETLARGDLELITRMGQDFGLPPALVNAVLDYTMIKSNGALPPKFSEKIAATLNRKGISDVVDAMNFLYDYNKKAKTAATKKDLPSRANTEAKSEEAEEVASKEEMERLLS